MARELTMSRAALLFLSALVLPACFDIQKMNPGDFVIDDFEDNDLIPRSTRFEPWSCHAFTNADEADGGQDGGADGGPDGGESVTCHTVDSGANNSQFALEADFQQLGGIAVRTHAMAPVDFTGFSSITYQARFPSGTPAGTYLRVELGCVATNLAPYATSAVLVDSDWSGQPLPLRLFQPPSNQACLQQIDSIRFTVRPGLMEGQPTSGTLLIDDVSLVK